MRHTIRSLDGLVELNAQEAKVRYRSAPHMPWEFAVLAGIYPHHFTDGGFGYLAHREISPRGTHMETAFTDMGFAAGLEVQLATYAEIRGKKWSYVDY